MAAKSMLVILALLLIAGCTRSRPGKKAPEQPESAFAALSAFQVDELPLNYAADCRIRIQTPAMDENGSCRILITPDKRFQMTIHSRLAGTLLSVYQDNDLIQVVNYHEKSALQLKNTEENRFRAFEIVNLNVSEFRAIFWGREISGEADSLQFGYVDGRPFHIRKPFQRSDQQVTIKRWLLHRNIPFPGIIEFKDPQRQIFLKVVITSFNPGQPQEPSLLDIPGSFEIRR